MNLIESIARQLAEHPRRELVVEVHGETVIPAEAGIVADLVARARARLRQRGLTPGSRVALVGQNGVRWVAADLACLFEGLVVVPVDPRFDSRTRAAIIADAEPAVVVVSREAFGPDADVPVLLFEELFGTSRVEEEPVVREEDAPFTLVYTAGTSGRPRGVVLTRRNVDFVVEKLVEQFRSLLGPLEEERTFHCEPFSRIAGRILLWACLVRGVPLWLGSGTAAELRVARPIYLMPVPRLVERLRREVEDELAACWPIARIVGRGTRVALTGSCRKRDRIVAALARYGLRRALFRRTGDALRVVIGGGAPLRAETQRWYVWLGIPLYQYYGSTETAGLAAVDGPGRPVVGKVGRPLPGVEFRRDEHDELVIRGPNVFAGYWRDPEATAIALREGWYHTGDRADQDDAGHWSILGRRADTFVLTGGERIQPEEIERELEARLRGIRRALLVGHGRPHLVLIVLGPVDPSDVGAAVEAHNRGAPAWGRIAGWVVVPEPPVAGTAVETAPRGDLERSLNRWIEALYGET